MHPTGSTTPQEDSDLTLGGRAIIPGLTAGHAAFHWTVQSFVVALPEIQRAFLLSGIGVGGILATREFATAIVRLPAGVAVDVWRSYWRPLLAGCLGALAFGVLVIGISPVYALLLFGIVAVAASHSIWHLASAATLSHHFERRRGVSMALHGVGGSIGDVAGPVATGALLAFLTWREILSIYAVPSVVLAILAFWAFRNIGHANPQEGANLSSQLRETRRMLRRPVLWGLAAVYGLRAMALVALLTVLSLYLDYDLGLSTALRGIHIGLLIAVGLVAKPIFGYLSDRLGRKQVLGPGLIWSCAMALALLAFDTGVMFTVSIALLGLFLYPDQPILTAAVYDTAESEVASTSFGAVSFVGSLMSVVSPLIAGTLYESVGFDATIIYTACLFGVAAVLFIALPLSRTKAVSDKQTPATTVSSRGQ